MEFWLILGLLVGTRILDNWTTYLIDPPLGNEANLFVKLHGFGWTGMLTGQAAMLGLLIWACAQDVFGGDEVYPRLPGLTFANFVSYYHTGQPGRWLDVFWRLPHKREILWRGIGYAVSRACIVISVLVTLSNLCHHFNQSYRSFYRAVFPYGFPLGVFAILLALCLWAFYRQEYRRYAEITQSERVA
jgi:hypothetical protein